MTVELFINSLINYCWFHNNLVVATFSKSWFGRFLCAYGICYTHLVIFVAVANVDCIRLSFPGALTPFLLNSFRCFVRFSMGGFAARSFFPDGSSSSHSMTLASVGCIRYPGASISVSFSVLSVVSIRSSMALPLLCLFLFRSGRSVTSWILGFTGADAMVLVTSWYGGTHMVAVSLGPTLHWDRLHRRCRQQQPVSFVCFIGFIIFISYHWRPSVLWRCWLGVRKSIQPVKTVWWGTGMVICLEQGSNDLRMIQLMPLQRHHLLFH